MHYQYPTQIQSDNYAWGSTLDATTQIPNQFVEIVRWSAPNGQAVPLEVSAQRLSQSPVPLGVDNYGNAPQARVSWACKGAQFQAFADCAAGNSMSIVADTVKVDITRGLDNAATQPKYNAAVVPSSGTSKVATLTLQYGNTAIGTLFEVPPFARSVIIHRDVINPLTVTFIGHDLNPRGTRIWAGGVNGDKFPITNQMRAIRFDSVVASGFMVFEVAP